MALGQDRERLVEDSLLFDAPLLVFCARKTRGWVKRFR
jgi:hypothetical protein